MKPKIILSILFILFGYIVYSQQDTVKSQMEFDLGLTRDKNINLWPVFKYANTPQTKDLQIIFPLAEFKNDFENKSKHSHILPLWWYTGNSENRDTRILSLYYPSLIHTQKQTDYKSFKFVELAPKINLLEISRSKDGMTIENNFLFLLWYRNYKLENRSSLGVFPLYWSFRSTNSQTDILLPIFAKGKYNQKKDKYFVFTPLYWNFKTETGKKNILFPIFWNFKSGAGENLEKKTFFFPLYWSLRSPEKKENVFFPIIWNFKNPNYNSFTIFPLFSKGNKPDGSRKYFCITPLIWHTENPNSKTNIFFPIWWQNQTQTADIPIKTSVIFPLFWKYSKKDTDVSIFVPFWWKINNSGYTSKTLLPLFSKGYNSDKSKTHFTLTPLFWKIQNNKTKLTTFLPLIWNFENENFSSFTFIPLFFKGTSKSGTQKYFGFTPLFWSFKNYDKKNTFLFPIFWSNKSGSGENLIRRNYIFPVFYSKKSSSEQISVLFPVVFSKKNSVTEKFAFFPIFSKEKNLIDSSRRYRVLLVLSGYKDPQISKTNLFPVYWHKKTVYGEERKTFFPLYWNYKNSVEENTVFFPFVWKFENQKYKSFTLFPIISKGQSKDSLQKYTAFTPLFWKIKNPEFETKLFFPIFYKYKSAETENKIIFPVIWKFSDYDYNSFTLFPLFSKGQGKENGRSYFAASPLFWNFKNPETERNIFFPLFWNKKTLSENPKTTNVLFPIFWSLKDKDNDIKVAFPFIWKINTIQYKSFTVFPFFSKGNSADGTRKHRVISPLLWHYEQDDFIKDVFFPIWWKNQTGTAENKVTRKTLFPYIFKYESTDIQKFVFFPFIWKYDKPEISTFTFFPLFSKGKSKKNKFEFLAITPVFWQFKDSVTKVNILLPIFCNYQSANEGNPNKFSMLFPFVWSRKTMQKDNFVFFPIIWKFDTPELKSFTFFPLFSYKTKDGGVKKHLFITPFIWNIKNHDENYSAFVPLYWKFKSGTGENTKISQVFFPLLWSKKEGDNSSTVLFPFIWKFKNSQYSSFTLFPLVSQGKNAENTKKYFAFTPFVWMLKNSERKLSFIFPVFWTYKNENKQNSVLFPFVWKFKNEKNKSFTFFPLFSAGTKSDSTKFLVLTPVFWKFSKPNYSKTVLFPLFSAKRTPTERSSQIGLILFRRYKSQTEKTTSFIFPLCEKGQDSVSVWFRVAPIIWYKKHNDFKYFSIQPIFYTYKNPEYKSVRFFWQFLWFQNYFGTKKSRNFLWKTVFWDTYQNKDYEFRFLYMVISNVKKEGKIEKSFFPLYHYSADNEGNKSLFLFFYFYNSYQRKIENTEYFYSEKKIFWFIRLVSNKRWLEQKGIKY